ncbi:MAG: ATP-binding cassette domain-containing protein [Caldilineaceae bacterium]
MIGTPPDVVEPILQVQNLHTHFFTGEGIVHAVDGASFVVHPGQTLGIVGESGCGKSVAAKSILQIVDKPGRIVDGEILYTYTDKSGRYRHENILSLPADSRQMKSIRGGEIAIFQEPMSSFSPIHTVPISSPRPSACTPTWISARPAKPPLNG